MMSCTSLVACPRLRWTLLRQSILLLNADSSGKWTFTLWYV